MLGCFFKGQRLSFYPKYLGNLGLQYMVIGLHFIQGSVDVGCSRLQLRKERCKLLSCTKWGPSSKLVSVIRWFGTKWRPPLFPQKIRQYHPWRIHGAAIYGAPWIPYFTINIPPINVSIFLPAPAGSVMGQYTTFQNKWEPFQPGFSRIQRVDATWGPTPNWGG